MTLWLMWSLQLSKINMRTLYWVVLQAAAELYMCSLALIAVDCFPPYKQLDGVNDELFLDSQL